MMLTTREVILLGLTDGVLLAQEHELPEALEALGRYVQHVRQAEALPDTLGPGWNRPAPAATRDVAGVLDDALARVLAGDSWEGTITWTMPTDEPELEGAEYGLLARYRIGNRDGQGGLRVYQGEGT